MNPESRVRVWTGIRRTVDVGTNRAFLSTTWSSSVKESLISPTPVAAIDDPPTPLMNLGEMVRKLLKSTRSGDIWTAAPVDIGARTGEYMHVSYVGENHERLRATGEVDNGARAPSKRWR